MSADNWQKVCAITLDFEGGNDDDPHDPGGRTSRGILQREWDVFRKTHPGRPPDVWKAPQADIVAIYHDQYWTPVSGDVWPAGMDLVVYDAGVNSGTGKALSWSRYTLGQTTGNFAQIAAIGAKVNDRVGFVKRFQARRLSFLEALRTWAYFGKGWAHRVAGIEALALKMVATGANLAPAAVLAPEQAKASKKSTAAGGGATVATSGTGAHVGVTDIHSWLDIALTVGVCLAGVALVAYLVHVAYTQRARALAMGDALK